MRVSEIDVSIAAPFIRKWHYSGTLPRGSHICLGWFRDKDLYAVADYGNGSNKNAAQYVKRLTGEAVTIDNMIELKRLCRIEPKDPKLQLTQFLAKCHRFLKKVGYRYVISYSDPEYGHDGGIYRAANFQYLGKTDSEKHLIDEHGNIRHRLTAKRFAENNNITTAQAREMLGLKVHRVAPKDRWFYRLHGQKWFPGLFMELDIES